MRNLLLIGDRNYSSWSLRAWLVFEHFGIDHEIRRVHLDSPEFVAELAPFAPARTVPLLRLPGGALVYDTLAIAETLAERYSDLALWPAEPAARARARSIVAEMHAGFGALRDACPMNLRRSYVGFAPSEAVGRDLALLCNQSLVDGGEAIDEVINDLAKAQLQGRWTPSEAGEQRRLGLLPSGTAPAWDDLMVSARYMHALSLLP